MLDPDPNPGTGIRTNFSVFCKLSFFKRHRKNDLKTFPKLFLRTMGDKNLWFVFKKETSENFILRILNLRDETTSRYTCCSRYIAPTVLHYKNQ
jgi:hypothetical protein